jgi:hypothetical protein
MDPLGLALGLLLLVLVALILTANPNQRGHSIP